MGPWHRHQSPVITPAREGICANRDRCGGRASCRGWGLHGQPQTPPGQPGPPCQQPALQGLPSGRAGLLVSRMWVPAPLTPRPALSPQAGWRTGPWGELASHPCSGESSGHCARPLQAGPLTMRTSWRGSSSPLDIRVLGPVPRGRPVTVGDEWSLPEASCGRAESRMGRSVPVGSWPGVRGAPGRFARHRLLVCFPGGHAGSAGRWLVSCVEPRGLRTGRAGPAPSSLYGALLWVRCPAGALQGPVHTDGAAQTRQRGRASDRGGGQAAKRKPGVGAPAPQDEHGRRQRVSGELCRPGGPRSRLLPLLSRHPRPTGTLAPASLSLGPPSLDHLRAPAPPAQLAHTVLPLLWGHSSASAGGTPLPSPTTPHGRWPHRTPSSRKSSLSSQARWEPVPHSSKVDARASCESRPR